MVPLLGKGRQGGRLAPEWPNGCPKLWDGSFVGSEALGYEPYEPLKQKVQNHWTCQEDGARLTLLLRLAPVLPLPFDSYWPPASTRRADS